MMPNPWTQRYADLQPDATQVLTALTALGVSEVDLPDLAVAMAVDESALAAPIATLQRAGWIDRRADGGCRLVDDARDWLAHQATPAGTQTAAIVERYLTHHASRLDPAQYDTPQRRAWVRAHKDVIVQAIRSAAQAGLPAEAARLAGAAWAVADDVVDPVWWRELAHHGEQAAIQARDPHTFLALLNRSAAVYAAAEHYCEAEQQQARVTRLVDQMRERHLVDEAGYQTLIVANLTERIALYRRWKRFGRALDLLLDLADEQQRAGNPVGFADALCELGDVMLVVGRAESALVYLQRADQVLTRLPAASAQPTTHAWVLEQWGRAEWQLGHRTRARRRFRRARTVLAYHDPAAAARLDQLLGTPTTATELPSAEAADAPGIGRVRPSASPQPESLRHV